MSSVILPYEIILCIVSYTNLATVISFMRCNKKMNSSLVPIYELLSRPKNFRMKLCGNYIDGEEYSFVVDSYDDAYVLGRAHSESEKVFNGFTPIYIFNIEGLQLRFGYSDHEYVIYSFRIGGVYQDVYVYLERQIVNMKNLRRVISELADCEEREVSPVIVYFIRYLVSRLPCDSHNINIVTVP